ncbi:MAG: cysteine--tRNA ligase [Candidatus Pacebacteria bacterium]|nr:cysteine--tRNA ligase [Candidatus Paceibacterota bacterium]
MSFFEDLLGHPAQKDPLTYPPQAVYLYNTMAKAKELFAPRGKVVKMYNCGPTVYGEQHIGNLSMFVFTDLLRRTLEFNGYPVKQVINITDVGHLVSDGDDGDDKMTKGLKREKMKLTVENMKLLAERYATQFIDDLGKLNIDTAKISFPRATNHIPGQVALIKTLDEKGYVYKTSDGLYFDTTLFKDYGKLGNIDIEALKEGARVDANSEKRHPADFALWKFNEKLGWDTPWGKGFPGWHIECSAMARSELGEQIDIHTGGIEHIPVHHNNEIAQSEAAFGKKPFSLIWMHREHLQMNDRKIAKSDGNVVYLGEFEEKSIDPIVLRYWLLTSHYRTPSNFTWEALTGAETALLRLRLAYQSAAAKAGAERTHGVALETFHRAMNDDIDTPKALAALWQMMGNDALSPSEIAGTLEIADTILGINIKAVEAQVEVTPELEVILKKRKEARDAKDWKQSDALRDELKGMGFIVADSADGAQTLAKA